MSLQIGDSTIAGGLDSETHLPINRTQSFDVNGNEVYSWLSFTNVSSPSRNVTWIWLTPGKHQYLSDQTVIPDPGPGKTWTTYYVWSNISINGTAASQLTGVWAVDIFTDGVKTKMQNFSITDSSPLYQPTEGYACPNYNIRVNIQPGPQYARQDIINAMKQWNTSQIWFQKKYGLTPKPIYNLIVSNSTSDPVQITFNQTQTSSDWGYTQSSNSHNSSGYFTPAAANISIVLSLKDGTKIDDVGIETVAMHEIGHLLGLSHVERAGDLMNPFVGEFYDLNNPSTLNLYTIYQISNITKYGSILSYYALPDSIAYIESPPFNATQTTLTTANPTSTQTNSSTIALNITQTITQPTITITVTQTTVTTIENQGAAKALTANITKTITQQVTITTTISLTKTMGEASQFSQPLLLAYLGGSLIVILALTGLLLAKRRSRHS